MHTVVICGRRGNVLVIHSGGQYVGVEAVGNKDLVAAMIAEEFCVDTLVILTDVAGGDARLRHPRPDGDRAHEHR